MIVEHSNPRTLRELLDAMAEGFPLHCPILVQADPDRRPTWADITETMPELDPDGKTAPMKVQQLDSAARDWKEELVKEYADGPIFFVGANIATTNREVPILIGRSRECHLQIPSESVSKEHAAIHFDRQDGAYHIVDEHSRNGTRIGDCELTPGLPMRVCAGDMVEFGDALFVFMDCSLLRSLVTGEREKISGRDGQA